VSLPTSGVPAPATLDGLHLTGIAADSLEVVEVEIVGNVQMAGGGMREQRLAPAPGEPVIRRWYRVTLDYRHLSGLAPAVEARFAFPGPHELALWKHVCLGWLGDASRAEWLLPWRLAPHVLTPAAGAPLERFAAVVRLEWDGDPLTLVEPDTATYEAGTPAAGEVWIERGGKRLKLEAPPASGVRIIAHVVPLLRCVVAAEDLSRQYRDPIREPRKIVLVEAA
jgi:hypothetical protein